MPRKLTLEQIQNITASKGGECLSKKYTNNYTKLKFKCEKGHVWKTRPSGIKNANTWCPKCLFLSYRLELKEFQKIASDRGGRCISKEYVNSSTKLKWQCSEGHIWYARPGGIKFRNSWCNKCLQQTRKIGISFFKKLATKHNGKCLSNKYVNTHTKLKWQCSEGHIWYATPASIKGTKKSKGVWCKKCSRNPLILIEDCNNIASDRDGKCLSKKYVNSDTKLKWQCSQKHTWFAVISSIKRGTWCPSCNIFYNEALCKTTFEQIFNSKFIKVKPDWLVNKANNRMELDGYCSKYKIAFEYQGEQHFKKTYYNKENNKVLEKRIRDDRLKFRLCRENNIHLFIISYKDNMLELPELIKKKSQKLNLDIGKINFEKKIDLNLVYQHKNYLKKMKDIAFFMGGKLLSKNFIHIHGKLKWQCSLGHIWSSTASSVTRGNWCRKCAGSFPLTLEEFQKIASDRGGKCLSKKYVNNTTKLKFECEKGHVWKATPGSIKGTKKSKGVWCLKCSKIFPLTLEEFQKIASDRGGKCLSKKYVNNATKLNFECEKGHVWKATPGSIKGTKKSKGVWCPKCYQLTFINRLKEFQKIASDRGGKCLSKKYVNNATKLNFECENKHIWKQAPRYILTGAWCKKCK
jgi:hypothetical protein